MDGMDQIFDNILERSYGLTISRVSSTSLMPDIFTALELFLP
jgi:hypothetical protein